MNVARVSWGGLQLFGTSVRIALKQHKLISSVQIDIVVVRMDLGLNVTTCSAFLFIASSQRCGKQPAGYFGSTVDAGGKTELIM